MEKSNKVIKKAHSGFLDRDAYRLLHKIATIKKIIGTPYPHYKFRQPKNLGKLSLDNRHQLYAQVINLRKALKTYKDASRELHDTLNRIAGRNAKVDK